MLKVFFPLFMLFYALSLDAQNISPKFGKGLVNLIGQDSSFTMKIGLRFQNLAEANWRISEDNSFSDVDLNLLIRRARLKFNGFALNPKLKYKLELGLSNRDMSGGNTSDYSHAPRYILDAYIQYNFYKNWILQFGQHKLPGNRERVISSGDLQLVDRSRLNSRFNIDRDFGIMLRHSSKIGEKFILKQDFSLSQGEGRNLTSGNKGGLDFTFRLEALPFGAFGSSGDYVGSSIFREETPKLSIGVSYDLNVNTVKERAQNGRFIPTDNGFEGRSLYTWFADLMFKYQELSIMAEFADRRAENNNPVVMVNGDRIGTFYTGNAFNIQAGYFLDNKHELAIRYTDVNPDDEVEQDEVQYTIGFSRYIVGHKLKIQTDLTYRDQSVNDDAIIWRTQMDLHF